MLRVSLGLTADAGYSVLDAPTANWLLAPKKPKKLSQIPMPDEVAYIYSILGTTYRTSQPIQPAGLAAAAQF